MKTKLLLVLCLSYCMGFAQKPPYVFPPPMISTFAGDGYDAGLGYGGYSGNGGQATAAELAFPVGVTFDTHGNLYIADYYNSCIRKVNTSGIITTVAGTGTHGFSGDGGQATAADLYYPFATTFDALGNLYISDLQNNRIRKVNTSGVISTIAGYTATGSYSGDGGQATAAGLYHPAGLTFDAHGNLFIADEQNNVIRKINTSGVISTFAGDGYDAGSGFGGYSGDGGQATAAELYLPYGIAIDAAGNSYIADTYNYRIRKVNTSGVISTFAGTGTRGITGDGGQATAAEFNYPYGIALDASGNLYISDTEGGNVRWINSSGVINTIAGTAGTDGYSGDCGYSTAAELYNPIGIAFDAAGNIYIADQENNVVRKLTYVCYSNAGPNEVDHENDCGGWAGVTIGTPPVPCLSYAWSPTTALSCTNCAQPTSSCTTTVNYTVTVSGTGCNTTTSTVQVTAQGCGSGCGMGCRVASQSTIGSTSTLSEFVHLSLYPNPSSRNVIVALNNVADYIRIIDMQGSVVYEAQNTDVGEFNLDISNYNKGIYFVMAKIGNTLEKQKLVVE